MLINDRIYSSIGIINLPKISSWEKIKEKSLWVNAIVNEQEQINNNEHLCFSFTTLLLNDLLSFSINLIDDKNQQVTFNSREKKNKHIKL